MAALHPDFQCPYCKSTADPTHKGQISTKGWIVFFALLILCFPVCFIGLFMREDTVTCAKCRMRLS